MRSDAELVHAALAGDREAFAVLVRRYERAVRATTLGVLGEHHAALDAAQDAFVAAYEQLDRLRDGAAFGAWMLRIARNHALNAARSASRRPPSPLPSDVAAVGRDGRLDDRSERLLAAVMKLPEHERLVVMLRYFDGQSVQKIAEIAGSPVGTITGRLTRARERLRQELREVEP